MQSSFNRNVQTMRFAWSVSKQETKSKSYCWAALISDSRSTSRIILCEWVSLYYLKVWKVVWHESSMNMVGIERKLTNKIEWKDHEHNMTIINFGDNFRRYGLVVCNSIRKFMTVAWCLLSLLECSRWSIHIHS